MSSAAAPPPQVHIQRPGDIESIDVDVITAAQLPGHMCELRVQRGDARFELLFAPKPGARLLLVFGQAALAVRDRLPSYHRWTWFGEFPEAHCVALNDPTLYLGEDVFGGWFQGTTGHFYMSSAAAIVGELAAALGIPAERVIFYGSSAGGFASMMMAAELRGAQAVAEIPQTDLARYHFGGVLQTLLRRCYGGLALADAVRQFPARWKVVERFAELGYVPNIYYVQNLADAVHLERHMQPFLAELEKLLSARPGLRGNRLLMEFYLARAADGDGHVVADRALAGRAIRAAIAAFVPGV